MARRESQGLQITLIVFVILTIMLLVTTIVFYQQKNRLAAENATLKDSNNAANTEKAQAVDENLKLKVWLGHTGQTGIDEIEGQYKRDMDTYAKTAEEVQRNYKTVPSLLYSAVQDRNKSINDLREELRQAQATFEQTKAQLQAAADEAKKTQAAKEAELLATRQEFEAYRAQLNQQKDEQATAADTTRRELEELQAKTAKAEKDAQRVLNNTENILAQRDRQIKELTQTTFEVPDGKVTWVNPRSGMVYVNLGSADGLRNQVTFSVYPVDVNNVAREDKKGTIEITRVVGDHQSEARIVTETGGEPILPGDAIYTPLWNADSAMHFALAGSMDINDDGQDDREVIRRLITMSHGTIDAEDKGGDVQGKISRNTRYLIRGDAPEVSDKEGDDSSATQRTAAWTKILDEARANGVEELSVQQLLDYIGYDGDKRTIPLGSAARDESRNLGATRGTSTEN